MGTLGRNFEFRIVPEARNRLGRFASDTTEFVIGSPVQGSGTFDTLGREIVEAADTATPPVKGRCGVVVYEHIQFDGSAGYLTTVSDLGKTPKKQAVQVVSGPNVKVVFKNTVDSTFLNTRDYEGRTMVAGAGATPTVAVGDYLEPHNSPSDDNGYWKETSTAANAWFVVTKVDVDRGEVEAQFVF